MHSDQILHFLSLTKAPQAVFAEEDAVLLSKLPGLLLAYSPQHPELMAKKIFEILSSSPAYADLHRVCIAKRIGLSNCLLVLSSEQSGSAPNRLAPGYSCFVKPESTLLQMKSTDIRTFPNASEVVQSFYEKGEPAQRSIKRIAESGFFAGICLPLMIANRSMGYLFLNSRTTHFAELRPVDYCILAFLQAMTTLAMSHELASNEYFDLAEKYEADYLGDFFNIVSLEESLGRHFQSLGVSCEVKFEQQIVGDFLFSAGQLAQVASRYVRATRASKLHIRILGLTGHSLHCQLEGDGTEEKTMPLDQLLKDCRLLRVETSLRKNTLDLRMLCDPAVNQRPYRYSLDSTKIPEKQRVN